jgi:hypothetical protein
MGRPSIPDRTRIARVLVLWTAVLAAPPIVRSQDFVLTDDRAGYPTAPILLLSREDVRQDLGLDERQTEAARKAVAMFLGKAEALRGDPATSTDLASARRDLDQAQLGWIEHYLSGNQQTRLVQLELQWEGASALVTRPAIASEVRLSDAQRKAIVPLVITRNRHRIQGESTEADDHALSTQLDQTLTTPQKELWASLQGRPFLRRPQPPAPPATAAAPASTTRR